MKNKIIIGMLVSLAIFQMIVILILILQNNAIYKANQDLSQAYFDLRLVDKGKTVVINDYDQVEKSKKKRGRK